MLLWSVRALFLVVVLGIALTALAVGADLGQPVLGVAAAVTLLGVAGAVVYADSRQKDKKITAFTTVYLGLLLGLLFGWLVGNAFESLAAATGGPLGLSADTGRIVAVVLRLWLTAIACYVSVSILSQTRDDFRFVIPFVEFTKQVKGGRPLVLDTSVIIDGRIADLCETRIIDTRLIVPRFVL